MLATLDGYVQIYVNGAWVDITNDVFGPRAGYIQIDRGLSDEQTRISSSTCDLSLNNRNGLYSPRNPLGTYYGSIGMNTPIRIFFPPIFATPIAGTSPGTSLASWLVDAPLSGIRINYWHAISLAPGTYNITVAAGDTAGVERDGTYGTSRTGYRSITAGAQPILNATSSSGPARYVSMAVTIPGAATVAEEVTASNSAGGTITLNVSASAAAGNYLIVFNVFDNGLGSEEGMAMPDDGHTWYLLTEAADDSVSYRMAAWWRRVTVAGAVAITIAAAPSAVVENHARVLRLTGLGEGVAPADDAFRFHGVVPSWPATWDLTGEDAWVDLRALGLFGRLQAGARALESPIKRQVTRTGSSGLVAYVPMEDAAGASVLASGIAGHPPATIVGTGVTLASDSTSFPGSAPLPTLGAGGAVHVVIPPFTFTTTVSLRHMIKVPTAGFIDQAVIMDCFGPGVTRRFAVRYLTGGLLSVSAYDRADTLLDSDSHGFDVRGNAFMLALDLIQVGADISYNIYVREIRDDGTVLDGGSGGTFSGLTLVPPTLLVIGNGGNLVDATIGHAMVGNTTSVTATLSSSIIGYAGDTAGQRIERLCAEEGLTFEAIGDHTDTGKCGPQRIGTIMELLEDAAGADRGMLYESRWQSAVAYRTRKSLYGQAGTGLTLDYSASHLSSVPKPGDETATVRNVAVAGRRGGVQGVRVERTTGALGTDTVGSYEVGNVGDLNVFSDDQVRPIAEWEVALGTIDEDRYPAVEIELSRAPFRADLALTAAAVALELGDRLTITDMPQSKGIYWEPVGLLLGYTERLENLRWLLTYNTRPATPFDVAVADDDGARYDTTASYLHTSINSTATTVDFRVDGPRWTVVDAHFPFDIRMGGEIMTVTDILPPASMTQQTGTVAHGNNASVIPSLPASVASGDLLLLFAAIRNSGTGVVNTPSGWTKLPGFGATNVGLFGKIAGASESAPTVTFTGGVANADTSAQIARWRGGRWSATAQLAGLSGITRGYAAALNASAQDAAVPGLVVQERYWLIIQAAWKQDDWTSVASPSGSTEIDEPDTTTGDDQGIVWSWREQAGTPASIAAQSFVVTGGAAAISRSLIIGFTDDVQRFTVTRSVNGVVKSHTAGAAMSLAYPAIAAL